MSIYILLLTLTPGGREQTLQDPESVLRMEESIDVPGIQVLGMYGVLGNYDFVSIVEAPDNEAIARFSLDLGVRAGVHVTTLPAIPVTRLDGISPRDPAGVGGDDSAGALAVLTIREGRLRLHTGGGTSTTRPNVVRARMRR